MWQNSRVWHPRLFILATIWVALAGCETQPPQPPALGAASPELVRSTVYWLADPQRQGRGLGTAGLDEAANYISGYFCGLGLKPAPGQTDFFQPFTFTTVTGLAPQTAFAVGSTTYKLLDDFSAPAFTAEGSFAGPVVFVGYGVTAKDPSGVEYDDYAGVDVRGKVALAMRYEPHRPDGNSRLAERDWSENASLPRKAKLAAEHGALALLVVHPPNFHDSETYASPIVPMSRGVADRSPIPVIQVKQRVANEMLRQAHAADLKTFQSEIDQKFAPRSFALGGLQAQGDVVFERVTYRLKNVVGVLPGKGWHSDEYIVVGAHYDHLGHGGVNSREPRSHDVHPGADDNASGTAAVMELARIFSQAKPPLGRSLIFTCFSAEEEGVVGSHYFVEHPPVPLKKIVAMVNMDMVGRLRDEKLLVGGLGTARPFQKIVEQADAQMPLKLQESFGSGMAPSDNASFIPKRIPSLFFWTNLHEDYHRPTDTPDKINYTGESEIIDLMAKAIVALARTRDKDLAFTVSPQTATTQPGEVSMHGGGVSLGVIPDYTDESAGKGLRITGTVPGSPAEAAGLKDGDIITQIDQKKITSIYDLTDFLNTAAAGQPVQVHVLREGKDTVLTATPTARQRR